MNKVILVGRLTKDVDVRTAANGNAVARFNVAVNRSYKNAEGRYDADFISCIAFRNQAEFIAKYFGKGSQIGIVGSIQTGSYEKDGQRVYTTDVAVQEVEFVGSRQSNDQTKAEAMEKEAEDELFGKELDSFQPMETDDVSLPF